MIEKITSIFFSLPAKIALPLIVFIVAIAITFVRTSQIPKQYQATARIWVQTRGADMSGNGTGAQYLSSPLTTGINALATACEVIKSEAVVTAAREQTAKSIPAKFCPSAAEMNGALKLELVKDADIIKLIYTCGNDKISLACLQAYIDAFFHENTVAMIGNATKSKFYLKKQLEEANQLSQRTHDKLRQFQEQTQTINLEAQAGSLLSEKEELEKAILETQQVESTQRRKLEYLEKQLGFKAGDVMSVDALTKDSILKGLRDTIAEYEVKLVDLRAKYQEEHPKMKRLRAALEEAKQAMAKRSRDLIGTTDPEVAQNLASTDSDVRGKMLEEMVNLQADQVASELRLVSLQKVMGEVKSKLAQVPKQQVGLSELVRADSVATDSLAGVEKELQNVILTESVAMGVSNLKVIDKPTVQESTPSVVANGFMIALGLTAFTIVIQFLLDPKVLRISQVTGRLRNMTVEGWIPTLQPGMRISQTLISLQKLRVIIQGWSKQGQKIVLITSANTHDGKSTLAYGLALTLTDHGQRVMLIDANLAHPTLHIYCKEQASPGLADFLDSPSAENAEGAVRIVNDKLMLIPAGAIDPEGDAIGTAAFNSLIKYFEPKVDVLLIDGPACGAHLNALKLPKQETHVLVVARMYRTLLSSLKTLAAQLALMPIAESVIVMNDVNEKTIASTVTSAVNMVPTSPAESSESASTSSADVDREVAANW
ncbi:MAG: hypothetical protein JST89_17025 [Cyanobacteria bacterium SZAS-4]|nr:hypothetical protein [Cyanobacteria bacterium SZAS-4]